MMSRMIYGLALALVLAVAWILIGCGRGNGLPADLTGHLARHGIKVTPSRVHAPISSRGGHVVAQYAPEIATNLISAFSLQRIQPDDPRWRWAVSRAGEAAAVKELWGITGRPTQFKLKSGGQFECFYLLITESGLMYLVAEYAYG